MNWKCFFGFHRWIYKNLKYRNRLPRRTCLRCGRKEEGSYDMTYGETIWSRIK